ncbi:glutaredoxin family protein [Candidatus Woesearchaeota archaeon]|nr:glutaredoxin family protein [Candidatus Woesearchaeota archaeon]
MPSATAKQAATAKPSAKTSSAKAAGAKSPAVTVRVFSTPVCPWCVKAKEYLSEKGVPFTNFDVSTDEKARNEMIEKSGQLGVPVLDINGKIIVGFDQDAIDEALASHAK